MLASLYQLIFCHYLQQNFNYLFFIEWFDFGQRRDQWSSLESPNRPDLHPYTWIQIQNFRINWNPYPSPADATCIPSLNKWQSDNGFDPKTLILIPKSLLGLWAQSVHSLAVSPVKLLLHINSYKCWPRLTYFMNMSTIMT